MIDALVKQAIIELQDLVLCRCHPAYKDRNLHDPDCHCEDADNVALVAARFEELEVKNYNLMDLSYVEHKRAMTAESKAQAYYVLVKELFVLLDKTEETGDGRTFRPNMVYSCRAMDADKLERVLKDLKNVLED